MPSPTGRSYLAGLMRQEITCGAAGHRGATRSAITAQGEAHGRSLVVGMAAVDGRAGGRGGGGLGPTEPLHQVGFLSLVLFEQSPDLVDMVVLTHTAYTIDDAGRGEECWQLADVLEPASSGQAATQARTALLCGSLNGQTRRLRTGGRQTKHGGKWKQERKRRLAASK